MKVRNFYPRQVLRKLQGEHANLDKGQEAALRFVMGKGRKLGYSVMSGPTASAEDFLAATSNLCQLHDAHRASPCRLTSRKRKWLT